MYLQGLASESEILGASLLQGFFLKVKLCCIAKQFWEVDPKRATWSATPLCLLTCESLAIIFHMEYVKMKEITVKLLKLIKHTFKNTTYSKAISSVSARAWHCGNPTLQSEMAPRKTKTGPIWPFPFTRLQA